MSGKRLSVGVNPWPRADRRACLMSCPSSLRSLASTLPRPLSTLSAPTRCCDKVENRSDRRTSPSCGKPYRAVARFRRRPELPQPAYMLGADYAWALCSSEESPFRRCKLGTVVAARERVPVANRRSSESTRARAFGRPTRTDRERNWHPNWHPHAGIARYKRGANSRRSSLTY